MAETISEIKNKINNCDKGGLSAFIATYETDSRQGVKLLVKRAKKKLQDILLEEERIKGMWQFEKPFRDHISLLCGIDEAGRGPLAGPVVAGAVILPENADILYINDSKKLTEARREMLYEEIKSRAVAVGVGMASVKEIDSVNILQATYLAMKRAIQALAVIPELLLNDAVTIPGIDIPQEGIVGGDGKSISIAAASIIAKVTRDRLMLEYEEKYPGYGFKAHKGYGTREHYEAIRRLGASPIHRKTFLKKMH